jgi:4-hydroxy 2-oxovalerate aldolase
VIVQFIITVLNRIQEKEMEIINNKDFTLVDCTLRDGGYYTNWEFDKNLSKDLVKALNSAGTDIVELGYKSPKVHNEIGFEGLFRFCPESQLAFVKEYTNAKYAFMIDAKEFVVNNQVDKSLIYDCIIPKDKSLFSWCRIATYHSSIQEAATIAEYIKELGYKISMNLMGISLLKEDQIIDAISSIEQTCVDVFYFSDSFGSMHPSDVGKFISLIRRFFHREIGIHTHDNQGLAFASTLAAINNGIDFIDTTLMGMGRGAGNLKTEQLYLYLYYAGLKELNPSELISVIDRYFKPLYEKYKWGWDYAYMLGALKNIHPTYCHHLRTTNQYSMEQISSILNNIQIEKRSKFSEASLNSSIDIAVNSPILTKENLIDLPLYEPMIKDTILVIATGASVQSYENELIRFIKQHNVTVIECNPRNDVFENAAEDYYKVILNWVRLESYLAEYFRSDKPVITGIDKLPESFCERSNVYSYPCHVKESNEERNFSGRSVYITAYVVGMFSIAIAQLSEPKTIYLAGFDGYGDTNHPKHIEMETFFKNMNTKTDLYSITPSTYSIKAKSIYGLIT